MAKKKTSKKAAARAKTVRKGRRAAGGASARGSRPRRRPAAKPPAAGATPTKSAGISDAAVRKATGRTWAEWFKALNAAGARAMDHKQIAELVYERFGVGPWWSQMVTVGYEHGVLGREKHRKGKHYEVGASRTINASVAAAFDAWISERTRAGWLPGADLAIRKATPHKSIRITWDAAKGVAGTLVSVNFWVKGPRKCMVQVGHGKIADAKTAEQMKVIWGERLEALRRVLER